MGNIFELLEKKRVAETLDKRNYLKFEDIKSLISCSRWTFSNKTHNSHSIYINIFSSLHLLLKDISHDLYFISSKD